ncbi:MAG: hypothetical protein IH594_10830 [Bacteroidales bacterium]|nr:hypothetical protein [Bacteroidales bacterium]
MHFHYLKPSALLNRFIRHYWVMESGPSEINVTERVIPTGNIQLMFHYKKPFIVCHPDRSQTRQGQSIISGLSGSYCDVTTTGETGVIAVEFFPAGASHFFSFPMDEVENQSVALADIVTNAVFPLLFLSTTFLPRELITADWLLAVSWGNPVTWILEANRYLLAGTSPAEFFYAGLVILLLSAMASVGFALASAKKIRV